MKPWQRELVVYLYGFHGTIIHLVFTDHVLTKFWASWFITLFCVLCLDIDECYTADCSQVCHNYPGSYSCSCRDGWFLSADGVTCFGTMLAINHRLSSYVPRPLPAFQCGSGLSRLPLARPKLYLFLILTHQKKNKWRREGTFVFHALHSLELFWEIFTLLMWGSKPRMYNESPSLIPRPFQTAWGWGYKDPWATIDI